MAFGFEKSGPASRNSISDIVSDREWDIEVFAPVPKKNVGCDILQPESPRTRIQFCLQIGPTNAVAKCFLQSIYEQLRHFRLVQQLAIQLGERLYALENELIGIFSQPH